MTATRHRRRCGSLVALAGVAFGCGNPDSRPSQAPPFEISDSAGVTVVRNPAQADWELAPRPTVQVDLRIGAATGAAEYEFGLIGGVAVASNGDIHVLDRMAAHVRVFDTEGRYLRTIGRPGSGPGELSGQPSALAIGPGDTVYVAHLNARRIEAFAPDGSSAGSVALPPSPVMGSPTRWATSPEGEFLSQETRSEPDDIRVVRRHPRGTAEDTLLSAPRGEGTMQIAMPFLEWALLTDGRLAHGATTAQRFEILDRDGRTLRVVEGPVRGEALSERERNDLLDEARRAVETSMGVVSGNQAMLELAARMRDQLIAGIQVGSTAPTFARLLGGPRGTLWVERVRPLSELRSTGTFGLDRIVEGTAEWDVFDTEGRLLGAVRLPDGFRPLRTVGDRIYGVEQDDLGVHYLVRVHVQGLEGGA